MLISNQGTLVRTRIEEVSQLSRNTKGVTLIRLAAGERLVGIERIPELEGDGEDGDEEDGDSSALPPPAAEGVSPVEPGEDS